MLFTMITLLTLVSKVLEAQQHDVETKTIGDRISKGEEEWGLTINSDFDFDSEVHGQDVSIRVLS